MGQASERGQGRRGLLRGAESLKEGVDVEKVDILPQGFWERLGWAESSTVWPIGTEVVEERGEEKAGLAFHKPLLCASAVPGGWRAWGALAAQTPQPGRKECGSFRSWGVS